MSARLQALCCGLFNLSLGWWVPWYTAVIAVSAAPLLVIEVERGISAATDQVPYRFVVYIRLFTCVSCIYCFASFRLNAYVPVDLR